MPNYVYTCSNCGQFEHFKRMVEPDLETCPTCGNEVQRVYSIPTVHFHGTGFYRTDADEPKRGKDGRIIDVVPDRD